MSPNLSRAAKMKDRKDWATFAPVLRYGKDSRAIDNK